MADFLLGLGYSDERVLNTLISRCNLDVSTAQRIIDDAQTKEV